MSSLIAVLPAAGRSLRMGRSKPLLRWKGHTFLEIICEKLAVHGIPTVVVTRPDQEDVLALVRRLADKGMDLLSAFNPLPRSEMIDSVSFGLRAFEAEKRPWQGLLVWPTDCPATHPGDLAQVLEMVDRYPHRVILPTWQGRGGHPTYFPKALTAPLLQSSPPLRGSLRDLMATAGDPIEVPAQTPGVILNANHPGVLDELETMDPELADDGRKVHVNELEQGERK